MASANQRQTHDKRVNTLDGHYVKWDISARDLALLQSWDFVKNYRTFCQISPSAWDFKMSFPEIRGDSSATLSIQVKRVDTLDRQLDLCIWLDVFDPNESLIYPKKSFVKGEFKSGDVWEETAELEPYPYMHNAINRSIIVRVTLMVTECHPSE